MAMPGKKNLLSRALAQLGITRAGLHWGPRELTILAYHRVLDVADESRFPADPELVSASTTEFRRQMAYLRQHWNPIALSAAVQAFETGEPLPPRSVAVTFDDGHADNYTHALPVMREFDIPATIFLATQYINGGESFWFDRVTTLLFFAPEGVHTLDAARITLTLSGINSRRAESDRLQSVLKRLPDAQRHAALGELEAALGHHAKTEHGASHSALSWAQVREMTQHRIDFGSHTVTHPVLSTQTEERVRFELSHSREVIRQHTGQPVDLLAYPVGKAYAFNQRVIDIAKECGYRAALAYIDGVNDPATANRFALRRIAVERYIPHHLFMARMTFPRIFV